MLQFYLKKPVKRAREGLFKEKIFLFIPNRFQVIFENS